MVGGLGKRVAAGESGRAGVLGGAPLGPLGVSDVPVHLASLLLPEAQANGVRDPVVLGAVDVLVQLVPPLPQQPQGVAIF